MGACPRISDGDLSEDEAYLILEPFFVAMRDDYLEHGLAKVRRTQLRVDPAMHDTPRHFAACREDGLVMVVAPEMADLPYPMVVGIFAHEFGHAADFLYPAQFLLDAARSLVHVPDDPDEVKRLTSARRWDQRDDDDVEFTADAIAEYVTGARIGYLGPCRLQVLGAGKPRPQGLR